MFSAFTARPIIELKPKEKPRIESVLAYGDRLFVGLNHGTLRVYRLPEIRPSSTDSDAPTDIELLKEIPNFSKHSISQLAYIKEIRGPLLSLSGSIISFYDSATYELQETLAKSKGATTFAVTSNVVKDEATEIPQMVSRLAVAVKRKLLLWTWRDSELANDNPEFTLVTAIKSLTWITATRLVAGLSSSYVLVDVESGKTTDIVGPGSIGGAPGQDSGRFGVASIGYMGMGGMVPKPLATRLGEGEVLLAKDINTHFINTDGEALGRRQIPWSMAPEAVGYSYPFLLSLQPTKQNGVLEVRNPQTQASLQQLSLPGASMLCVPNPYVSLAHAGKGFLVASEKCVWRMDALGYDDQIEALLEKGAYDEAISLLGMLEDALLKDKKGRVREAKMLKAQALFDHRRYRDSLDLFTEAEAPPERVIAMYPAEISGDLGTDNNEDDANEGDEKQDEGNGPATSQEKPAKKGINDSLTAAGDDNASIFSVSLVQNFRKRRLEGKELRTAANELRGFLVDARTKLQRYVNWDGSMKEVSAVDDADGEPFDLLILYRDEDERTRDQKLLDTFKLVDTTLFRTYMLASPSLAGSLFRLPNFCDPNVVEDFLLQSKRYVDLIDFLYGKRLHAEALTMLKEFGSERTADDEVPEALQGPQRTVAYLQNLGPEHTDLILQYAEWPISVDADLGMEVFVADTENAELLPRDKVVDFLGSLEPNLQTRYLEHIINELDDDKTAFHQSLIDLYLTQIDSTSTSTKDKSHTKEDDQNEDEKRVETLEKLLAFLKKSNHYDPYSLLRKLPKDNPSLHEARAIVLGAMNQHRQALSIYVFDMSAPQKAEDYCNQVYVSQLQATDPSAPVAPTKPSLQSTPSEQSSIYHDLLSLYLSPPPPHQAQWDPALDLLAKHGARLPASAALSLIPGSLPVKRLEEYFTTRIRAANSIVSEAKVVGGLRKSLDVEEEVKLRLSKKGRNRAVVVTEERVCGVCHKRFGGSVIKVLPNNSVVHYGCSVR